MVDTKKVHKFGKKVHKFGKKLGITCMQVSSKGVASTLVFTSLLEDEQRLSVRVLLTVLKSEIKPSTPASFLSVTNKSASARIPL